MSLPTDPFLNILGEKLRNKTQEKASDADWDAFEQLYLKPEKKRRILWWWIPVFFLFSGMIVWANWTFVIGSKQSTTNFQTTENPKTIESISDSLVLQETNTDKNSNTNYISSNKSENQNKIEGKNSLPRTERNSKYFRPTEINSETNLQDLENTTDFPDLSSIYTNSIELNFLEPLVWKSKFRLNYLILTPPPIQRKYINNKRSISWMEIGAGIGQMPQKIETKNTLNWLVLTSLQGGIKLKSNWFFGSGINYSVATKTTKEYYEIDVTKMEIDHIDTSLTFDPSAARIVMNMDTAWTEVDFKEIKTRKTQTEINYLAIPLIFGYESGNQKHQLRLFGGIETGLLSIRNQELNEDQENPKGINKKSEWLLAPITGIAYSYQVGLHWGPFIQGRYRIATNQNEKQSIQFQTGLRFNF